MTTIRAAFKSAIPLLVGGALLAGCAQDPTAPKGELPFKGLPEGAQATDPFCGLEQFYPVQGFGHYGGIYRFGQYGYGRSFDVIHFRQEGQYSGTVNVGSQGKGASVNVTYGGFRVDLVGGYDVRYANRFGAKLITITTDRGDSAIINSPNATNSITGPSSPVVFQNDRRRQTYTLNTTYTLGDIPKYFAQDGKQGAIDGQQILKGVEFAIRMAQVGIQLTAKCRTPLANRPENQPLLPSAEPQPGPEGYKPADNFPPPANYSRTAPYAAEIEREKRERLQNQAVPPSGSLPAVERVTQPGPVEREPLLPPPQTAPVPLTRPIR